MQKNLKYQEVVELCNMSRIKHGIYYLLRWFTKNIEKTIQEQLYGSLSQVTSTTKSKKFGEILNVYFS